MNEKFYELSKEKQLRIINAAMEVFGSHSYRHALTDDIAAKAGISKGLLFYYFHDKKSLYMYVYEYCYSLIKEFVFEQEFWEIDDFFEMLNYGANKKISLLKEYPFIMNFVVKAYYSQKEPVSDEVTKSTQEAMSQSYQVFFKRIDFTKFKAEIDPLKIFKMLQWMTVGYLHEKQNLKQPMDLEEMMNEYKEWVTLFRPMVYKEEFV